MISNDWRLPCDRLAALTLILTRAGLAMDLSALWRLRFVVPWSMAGGESHEAVMIELIHRQDESTQETRWHPVETLQETIRNHQPIDKKYI